jgi:hypothetical protein
MSSKATLEAELSDLAGKLSRAEKLVTGLAGERAQWQASIGGLEARLAALPGDAAVAAAFLSYAGPFPSEFRDELARATWLPQVCARFRLQFFAQSHTDTGTHRHTHRRTHTQTHTHTHTQAHTHTHTHTDTHTHTHTHTQICAACPSSAHPWAAVPVQARALRAQRQCDAKWWMLELRLCQPDPWRSVHSRVFKPP